MFGGIIVIGGLEILIAGSMTFGSIKCPASLSRDRLGQFLVLPCQIFDLSQQHCPLRFSHDNISLCGAKLGIMVLDCSGMLLCQLGVVELDLVKFSLGGVLLRL